MKYDNLNIIFCAEIMSTEATSDPIRKKALEVLTESFIQKGCPDEYAPEMAASVIYRADLDLRNAQLSRILTWLQQKDDDIYKSAVGIVEGTREEFEKRVRNG